MKVLWLSPVPLPAMCKRLEIPLSYGGWWVHSLMKALGNSKGIQLVVTWSSPGVAQRHTFTEDGVCYDVFPEMSTKLFRSRKLGAICRALAGSRLDMAGVQRFAIVVADHKPDVVQVFGSERFHGLVAPFVKEPVIIWIQGILDVYRHHFFGGMPLSDRLRFPRLFFHRYLMEREAARERKVFRVCSCFIGRTAWDHAHQMRLRPDGRYFEVQDCFRDAFFESEPWSLVQADRDVVYTTTSPTLWKGTDTLVRAVALLREEFPKLRLRVAGYMPRTSPVAQWLKRIVSAAGVADRTEFLGVLNAEQIVCELRRARVFVLPSFIENNPNSLAEAMLVGTPSVASFTGGVPQMVSDGETGLLAQVGDESVFAYQMRRMLRDGALVARLSRRARDAARARYAPGKVAADIISVYEQVLRGVLSSPVSPNHSA